MRTRNSGGPLVVTQTSTSALGSDFTSSPPRTHGAPRRPRKAPIGWSAVPSSIKLRSEARAGASEAALVDARGSPRRSLHDDTRLYDRGSLLGGEASGPFSIPHNPPKTTMRRRLAPCAARGSKSDSPCHGDARCNSFPSSRKRRRSADHRGGFTRRF